MTQIAEILAANRGYAAAQERIADPKPSRHLAVVTCMDARIDVFAALVRGALGASTDWLSSVTFLQYL